MIFKGEFLNRFYVADDGKDFGDDYFGCAEYELFTLHADDMKDVYFAGCNGDKIEPHDAFRGNSFFGYVEFFTTGSDVAAKLMEEYAADFGMEELTKRFDVLTAGKRYYYDADTKNWEDFSALQEKFTEIRRAFDAA